MASKRPVVTEGNTPGKPVSKRAPVEGASRKSLFPDSNQPLGPREWSSEEISALVQHICLFWEEAWSDKWPTMKNEAFWNACEQDMQFLEDRSVHKISIDKLFSYPMISKLFNP